MARRDYSMMTAEELRLTRLRHRRVVLTVATVIVVGVIGYFGARPTRNAIKGWQSRRHAQKAFLLIEQEKWKDARDEAVAAYQLRPTEPQALRAVARFLSRTRQQQAFESWDQLAQKQPLTRDDLRDKAAVALATNEVDRATAAIDSLLADGGKDATPHDWLLGAQLRLQQGAPDKALDSLGHVFANPAATPREQLQATLLQLQTTRSGNAEIDSRIQSEAWTRLSKFAQADDAVGLDSLILLAQRQLATRAPVEAAVSAGEGVMDSAAEPSASATNPKSVASDAAAMASAGDTPASTTQTMSHDELIRRLELHPLAKAPQKFLAIDLQLQAKPDQREALISKAIADWKDAEAAQLAVLASWLNGKGEFQRQLDTVPLERAVQTRELFLQHVDALGALGQWDKIRRLLESERFPLEPVIQRMYLARCNAQLGNEAAAKNNWERALEAAASDVGKLMTLGDYAEKNGADQIAERAFTQATVSAPDFRPAWRGKVRAVHASGDTRHIHNILSEMLQHWPNDTAVLNDEAYMRLLLLPSEPNDQELLAIEQLAERLIADEPASLPHRTLLALARLRRNRPEAALQVYKDIVASRDAISPGALAVHAAVVQANGITEQATEEVQKLSYDKLLPEEQKLVEMLR